MFVVVKFVLSKLIDCGTYEQYDCQLDMCFCINGLSSNNNDPEVGLNKHNIRENLGQVLNDESQIEQALQLIMNNREVVVKHVLTKPKIKGKSLDT